MLDTTDRQTDRETDRQDEHTITSTVSIIMKIFGSNQNIWGKTLRGGNN